MPFLYTFSGQAPQNPTLDPILYGELPWFANFEMAQMIKYGMPGVWTHAFVDMWYPGYMGFLASNHNGMLRMYETYGNGGANTMKRRIGGGGEGGMGAGGGQTSREWYRPMPPYAEVEWSLRNNTNYMQTGVLSALELTSAFPNVVLENFYRKSRNSIEAGRKEAPFGYLIPAGGRDRTRVAWVVNILRMQGIEVGRATSELTLKEGTFPAGTFIVKRDQPYGRLAKILLEKQSFPDPNLRAYDDTGWTVGLMTHTDVKEIADKAILDVPVQPVTKVALVGTVSGAAGSIVAIAHDGSANMITLRYRLKDLEVSAAEFGLARRVDASRPSAQFYAPGPIEEAENTQPSHPVFYGYTAKTLPVRYAGGPLLSIQGLEADRDRQTLMRFRGTEAAILSGLMKGAAETRNRPAIAEIQSGKGRVLMFATNPCFRYQTLGEFNMLFNAVLHYNDVRQ